MMRANYMRIDQAKYGGSWKRASVYLFRIVGKNNEHIKQNNEWHRCIFPYSGMHKLRRSTHTVCARVCAPSSMTIRQCYDLNAKLPLLHHHDLHQRRWWKFFRLQFRSRVRSYLKLELRETEMNCALHAPPLNAVLSQKANVIIYYLIFVICLHVHHFSHIYFIAMEIIQKFVRFVRKRGIFGIRIILLFKLLIGRYEMR